MTEAEIRRALYHGYRAAGSGVAVVSVTPHYPSTAEVFRDAPLESVVALYERNSPQEPSSVVARAYEEALQLLSRS